MTEKSGMEKLDIGALSPKQQETLHQFKINTRIANEKYLRSHPEVDVLLSDFLREAFLKRPADIRLFAADHFTDPNLAKITQAKLKRNFD
ncbi:hypothetical protein GJAV_G00007920 [Gymnothorax javanicus]|nr:hypothetical protein GJAV_G00007920 [Gymnothorax javanicus]